MRKTDNKVIMDNGYENISNQYAMMYSSFFEDGRFGSLSSPMKDPFFSLFKDPFLHDKERSMRIMTEYFDSIGMQHKCSVYLAGLLFESWNNSRENVEERIWALLNGFLPDKIELYNLNKNNYKDYLSDFDYFLIHPLNNFFAFWINDKLTLKYMLQAPLIINAQEHVKMDLMPEYYLYIENDGHYSYLMNSPIDIPHNSDYLLNLLKKKQVLALKPSNGAGGKGFIKLVYKNNKISCNDKTLNKDEWNNLIKDLRGYLVTEYILQHKDLREVWANSACTLRIIATKQQIDDYDGGSINVIVSYARFGTKLSNGASNLSAGGVGIPFDFNTGKFGRYFYRYKKYTNGEPYKYERHPDTGVLLYGTKLPKWEYVRDAVYTLCNHFSSLEYFGFDIIITDEGMKLCEINTLPSLDYEQVMCGPIYKNEKAADFFMRKILKHAVSG